MNITDYKRVKGDLKKANADVAKLRKKASKKMGKQEYTDQFRESMRVSKVFYKELKLNNRANIISIICFTEYILSQQSTSHTLSRLKFRTRLLPRLVNSLY